ncbi:MAG: DUF3656 domain-containing protein [Eubacteriales bacterium]|nr:DUF3656 domain-containing protein [Eubacteriales bacterium]
MSEKIFTPTQSRRVPNEGAADFVLTDTPKLPELLSPAGSPRALEAAIEGGADAVYFGGVRHNARALAQNFTPAEIGESVRLAHVYGVKMYQTVNTLATDRELNDVVEDARVAYAAGVDALIVADLGVAAAIHRALPDFPLHASTQASGHCVEAAKHLSELGFCRMVCAREMSYEDICRFTAQSPIEAEVFVHGALCVCHSGQCLFSSLVGGRSGNRGECAQPCRLPYRVGKADKYPLSLKDLSLAGHIPELIAAGVASLKLEGRMKSPEYVLAVTHVFRRLLDERRAATHDEMQYLASIFSRDGFTDGYFTGHTGSSMLGVRREQDKSSSRALEPFSGLSRKLPLDMSAEIRRGRPMKLTVSRDGQSVTVTGEVPEVALRSPSEYDAVVRSLTRLGGTPYCAAGITLTLDDGLAVPVSKLNALRRAAVEAMTGLVTKAGSGAAHRQCGQGGEVEVACRPSGRRHARLTARFTDPSQITPSAREFFDVIYLPLGSHIPGVAGVVLPPVVFDSERARVAALLATAASEGATQALVTNLGHISLARDTGLAVHGDFRLNVTNSRTVAALEAVGIADVIVSPELSLPQIRDISGDVSAIVYGRIPLMILEKCVGRELTGCEACRRGRVVLKDRRGIDFPVLREFDHRSVIYNSLPTCMSERQSELDSAGILGRHFVFSVESPQEVDTVIRAFRDGRPLEGKVRRI